MNSVFFHIDLDAFYASVERLDNPMLKDKPVIVGARPGTRGVVSACSYEARKFGIHSAMPISEAYRKCPNGIFLPVRMTRYLEISEQIMKILQSLTPDFQQISVDEAFCDFTGTERLYGPPRELGSEIKKTIKLQIGLPLTIGIAPNKYLAKLATNFGKPDGLYMIEPGTEEEFLDKLSLKNLWGVGEKTLERLSELNITSIVNLRKYPLKILTSMLGEGMGSFLYNAVRGSSPDIFSGEPKSHSISNEVTFEYDRKDHEGLLNVILELSHQVIHRLLDQKAQSKTVAVKIRYIDFTTVTAQSSSRHWVSSTEELFSRAKKLFNEKWDGHTPIRLIGVGLSNVTVGEITEQQELFTDDLYKRKKVEEAVFAIKSKMGDVKITKASLMKTPFDDSNKDRGKEKK
jgi:DNA polymerase-4